MKRFWETLDGQLFAVGWLTVGYAGYMALTGETIDKRGGYQNVDLNNAALVSLCGVGILGLGVAVREWKQRRK